MQLARIFSMFDPDERKKKMEKQRRQALEKSQVPPLTGYHSSPPEIVSLDQLEDPDKSWLLSFQWSDLVRRGYGVESVKGKWVITDRTLFDRRVSERRKTLLRPVWKI